MRIGFAKERGVNSPFDRDAIVGWVKKTLTAEGFRSGDPWEVAIRFVEADHMREMNREWRGIDRATDVISFAAGEGEGAGYAGFLLGDIVIAPAIVASHAARYRTAFEREMARVLVHGLLHLIGYDHDTVTRRRIMRRRERELVAMLLPRRGRDAA